MARRDDYLRRGFGNKTFITMSTYNVVLRLSQPKTKCADSQFKVRRLKTKRDLASFKKTALEFNYSYRLKVMAQTHRKTLAVLNYFLKLH